MQRSGRKRLNVDIPIKLHEELGNIAKKRNCTITVVVLRCLVEMAIAEKKCNETNNALVNDINSIADLCIR